MRSKQAKYGKASVMSAGFTSKVKRVLEDNGESTTLSAKEQELLLMAVKYDVGPIDTAYQIIDDRQDAKP